MAENSKSTLKVKVGNKCYLVPFDEIIYMEKNLRKINLHTKKGTIQFYGRYCNVMPLLDERFSYCHRSFVLNMDEIRCLGQDLIILSTGDEIQFSKNCFQRLRNDYDQYKGE